MEPWLALLVLCIIGCLAWTFRWLAAEFVIAVENGAVRKVRGKVAEAFLWDVRSICEDCHITSGRIVGWRLGRRVTLMFSARIPKRFRQRFRNAWALYAKTPTALTGGMARNR